MKEANWLQTFPNPGRKREWQVREAVYFRGGTELAEK
jgi:hypothetical protein